MAVVSSLLIISSFLTASAIGASADAVRRPPPPGTTTPPSVTTPPPESYTPPPHRDYASYGDTAAGEAIGAKLSTLAGGAEGSSAEWAPIFKALDTIPGNEVGGTLDRLGPGESDSFTDAGLIAGRGQLGETESHLDEITGDGASPQTGKWLGWVEGSDGHFHIPDGPCKFDVEGFSCGVERDIGDSVLIGVTAGTSHTRLSWDDSGSEGVADANYVGSYGMWRLGRIRLAAGADYGNSRSDVERHIQIGDLAHIADSGFDGHPYAAFVGGSYDWRGESWQISPMLTMSYVGLQEDGYTESGAGPLDLAVDGRRNTSAQAGGGLRISREIHTGWLKLVPAVKAQWGRELKTGGHDTNASLADSSASTFPVNGPESPADDTEIGASLDAKFLGITAYVRYDHMFGNWNSYGYTTSAGVRSAF